MKAEGKNKMLTPSETIYRGFVIDGESDEDASRLARTALGSLVAAGWVLQRRGSGEPNSEPSEAPGHTDLIMSSEDIDQYFIDNKESIDEYFYTRYNAPPCSDGQE